MCVVTYRDPDDEGDGFDDEPEMPPPRRRGPYVWTEAGWTLPDHCAQPNWHEMLDDD